VLVYAPHAHQGLCSIIGSGAGKLGATCGLNGINPKTRHLHVEFLTMSFRSPASWLMIAAPDEALIFNGLAY